MQWAKVSEALFHHLLDIGATILTGGTNVRPTLSLGKQSPILLREAPYGTCLFSQNHLDRLSPVAGDQPA